MNPIPCAHCGESFMPKRSSAKYCSASCRQAARRQRNAGPARSWPYLLTCKICQVEYLATRSDSVYCSASCRQHARRQRQGQEGPTPAPALWREGEGLERVREAKATKRMWDRRQWSSKW